MELELYLQYLCECILGCGVSQVVLQLVIIIHDALIDVEVQICDVAGSREPLEDDIDITVGQLGMEPLLFDHLVPHQHLQELLLQQSFQFLLQIHLLEMPQHLIWSYHLLIDVSQQLAPDLEVPLHDPI